MVKKDTFDNQIHHLFIEYTDKFNTDWKATKNITFQVTDACNLRCTYCYQINKHHNVMPFEVAKKFIDMLLDNDEKLGGYVDSDKTEAAVIEFIGGEPFLEIDLIDKISDYFIQACIDRNHRWAWQHRFSICSNGVLYFDPKVQAYMKKHQHDLSFSISIDGNKKLHDACRVFPDGRGSYDIAIAGVKHYTEVLGGSMGSKMTIAPQNVMYIAEAVKSLIENKYEDINLNCVFEEGWTEEHAKILYEQLKELADYIIDNDLQDKLDISIFNDYNYQPMSPEDNRNWCWGKGTPILTTSGYKPIEDIKIGNSVYTEDGSIHRVVNTTSHFADNCVEITASGAFPLVCTDNHKLFVIPFDYIGNKNTKHYKDFGRYEVSEINSTKDLIEMSKLPLGNISVDSDVAYLLGRYIGDGWNTQTNGPCICCGFDEVEEMSNLYKNASINFSHCSNKTVEQFWSPKSANLNNQNYELFTRLANKCGHKATGKRIPEECFNWDINSLESLINGYVSADGCTSNPKHTKCSTVSHELAEDVMLILRTIGYKPTCHKVKKPLTETIIGRGVSVHDKYEIYWNPLKTAKFYKEVSDKLFSSHFKRIKAPNQTVYNLTVDGNHSYIAGPYMSSNCGGTGSMISVDWKGDIYPCIRYMESSLGTDQKPLKIGNVYDGILQTKEEQQINNCLQCITRRSQSTDECWNCPIAQGCAWCFPAGTKINTPKGLVNIEDLVVGDEVLDGFGNIQKVENNFSRKSNDVVSINAAGIEDQYLTYDHPIYTKQVIKRNNNIPTYGKPTWVKAGKLKKSDKIALFVPKLGNKEINLDVAYLLGRYIGDGSKTSSNRTKTPYRYVISCAFDEKEELEKHFENSGIGYSISLHRTTYDFNIQTTSNLEFTKLIDDCGRYAIDKHIPSEVYKWDHKSVKALLEGYFDADGYLEKSKVQRYTSVSKNLVYQIAELIRAVYHKNVSITKRTSNPVGIIEGRQVNQNTSWEGRFNLDMPQRKYYEYDEYNNIMWVNVSKSKLTEILELEVYNLTVSNTHTFVANGVIVHNCSAYNYQVFGTADKRATFICPMHKAESLANAYYWNKVYRKAEEKEAEETGYVTLPLKRFKIWLSDEECLKFVSQEELDMLHELEGL